MKIWYFFGQKKTYHLFLILSDIILLSFFLFFFFLSYFLSFSHAAQLVILCSWGLKEVREEGALFFTSC